MRPEVEAVVLSAGAAALVGAVGAVLTVLLARRSVAWATLVGPVVVVTSISAGVLVTGQAMFLAGQDLILMTLVLAAAVPVAVACGFFLYRAVRMVDRQAVEAVAARERELALADSRREMITWASHDLKSPLAGIRVMAEALEDGLAPDPGVYHRRIRHESDRLARMVDDLLEMSRLEQGRAATSWEPVDLAEMTRDVVQGQLPVADQRGVHLEVVAPTAVALRVDAGRVERAVANLVHNAVLYTGTPGGPAGGRVLVTVGAEGSGPGRTAYLQVEDTCGGLPEEDLERAFQPGWRGSVPRTPGELAGAGVGLTITRVIAEDHGGRVTLGNVRRGCRVELRLPAPTP